MIKGTDPIRVVKGVGAKTEELMHNLGVYTVGDILSYFPRDYRIMQEPVKIADVKENAVNAILARTASMPRTRKGRRVAVTSCKASDGFREIELVWFRMPYVKNMLTPGKNQIFYGRVIRRGGKLVMEQPVIYAYEEYAQLTGRLLPEMAAGKLDRLLFCGTGALHSPTSAMQGESIPGICHAVAIEYQEDSV